MKRQIDSDQTIFFTPHYPSKSFYSSKRYISLIGIGGNLGNVKKTFDLLFWRLKNDRDIDIIKTSILFKNPDFASKKTPSFLNSVMLIKTNLTPQKLLVKLNRLEARFGRVRSYKNAPRTLDLDIIFFETKTLYNEKLNIPHKAWSKRPSVLVPMMMLQGN